MKKTVKKKPGRPPGRKALRRPVLSTRVPLAFYETLKQAAQFSTRTMSEELIWRATQTFERDNILEETRKLLDDARRAQEGAFRELMSKMFTKETHVTGVYWREKGTPPLAVRPELIPEIKASIKDAIREGFAAMKEEPK